MILRRSPAWLRATVAVVALYALLLQAFVGDLGRAAFAFDAGLSELCAPAAHEGDGSPAQRGPCDHCLFACAPAFGAAPDRLGAIVSWPERYAAFSPVRYPVTESIPARMQGVAHGARAPPSV